MHFYGEMRYGKHCQAYGNDPADVFKIEYLVVSFDDEKKEVKLSLRQADILEALANDAELLKQGGGVPDLARGETKYEPCTVHRDPDLTYRQVRTICANVPPRVWSLHA